MKSLNWRKNIEEALSEVAGGTKLPLLFFHNPQDEGSMKCLNDTLNNEKVASVIERETAPLIFNIAEHMELAKEYRVDWTPTFIICDERGRELERWVGFLPPEEFITQTLLSKGLAAFHLERYGDAIDDFEELIEEHTDSELVPEAEYFMGAANYKITGDKGALSKVCAILNNNHPESSWTKRCSVWAYSARREFVPYDGGGSAGSGAY